MCPSYHASASDMHLVWRRSGDPVFEARVRPRVPAARDEAGGSSVFPEPPRSAPNSLVYYGFSLTCDVFCLRVCRHFRPCWASGRLVQSAVRQRQGYQCGGSLGQHSHYTAG